MRANTFHNYFVNADWMNVEDKHRGEREESKALTKRQRINIFK